MASGGFQPNKQGKPEPKRRSNWQRSVSSDRDDTQSLNSLPSDIRINNWDLSDLWPANLGGDSKRRKKSKGNPEREREQSVSVDSPPQDHRQQRTPLSYPRTSTAQRLALENLRQHMTFSDMEDVSTDGERNNERQVCESQRRRLNHADLGGRHNNHNNNMDYSNADQEPDSNELMARLMQIRDFMKQARSMLDSMERLGDRKKMEDIEKVGRLIRNLQEQEQGYRGLLQNTLQGQEDGSGERNRSGRRVEGKEDSDDDTSVDLEVKTEHSETSDNSQESRPRIESKLGRESEEEDEQRDISGLELPEPLVSVSVSAGAAATQANTSDNATMSRSRDLDNASLPTGLQMPIQESEEGSRAPTESESPSLQHEQLLKILQEKQQQLQALMGRQEELNVKRRETEKKLLQAQARDNKARAALSAVSSGRQIVEKRLASHQAHSLEDAARAASAAQAAVSASAISEALEAVARHRQDLGQDENEDMDGCAENGDAREETAGDDEGESRVLKSNIVGYPESDDEDNSNVRELGAAVGSSLPNDLQELKRQLNFLRNEFSLMSESPKNLGSNSDASVDDGRQQLQNKLEELQTKRSGINRLLQELQMIHSQPLEPLQNNGSMLAQDSSNTPSWRPGPSNLATSRQQQQPREESLPPAPPSPPQSEHVEHGEEHLQLPSMLANLPSSSRGGGRLSLPPNLQASMEDMAAPTTCAVDNAMAMFARLAAEGSNHQTVPATMDPLMVSEVQEKLQRLKEVRGQLDQLRSLVQYYQDQKDDLEPLDTGGCAQSQQARGDLSRNPTNHAVSQSQLGEEREQEVEPSAQLELLVDQQQQRRRQPGREADGAGAITEARPFQNMAQLLNLAGTDEVDDHSDEENASVSQCESQWSHLGPWDDDPEIQEKVKKLKAAKEKLRQLQDLVAFVQHSPDTGHALADNLGDLEEGEGEAVSQATQTDEPNASVSEGEALSDSNQHTHQREDNTDGLAGTRAELERLRKERAMLLEIQSQLKQIQDQTEGTSVDRRHEQRERRGEPTGDLSKAGQSSNAPVVTFASNDELYSKMRRQRILREELRSKKKELEAIMKKDRNKRQYSRNQDNQSDTVSLNTDTFGIPASVDATMATWGGSTVDNLENITEDEDGQERNERANRGEDEEDDGYPSDGIVQVEEEEEENDSDNGTYTIEADARQRRSLRKGTAEGGVGARPKTLRGRQTYPQPSYGEKNTKKLPRKQNLQNPKGNSRGSNQRQEKFRPAEAVMGESETFKVEESQWFQQIQDRLSTLSSSVEVLLRKSDGDGRQLSVSLSQENAPPPGAFISPMQEQLLQLQNQSMMLSFGQVVQSLARQQGDMHHLQQQLQNLQLQVQEVHEQSFHSASHMLRPPLTTTPLNNSSYNLNQPMASPFAQMGVSNTAPAGFLGGFSPSVRSIQHQTAGLGLSTGNLSNAGVTSSVNPAQQLLTPGSGFVLNPLSNPGQANLNSNRLQTTSSSSLLNPHFGPDPLGSTDYGHQVSSPRPDEPFKSAAGQQTNSPCVKEEQEENPLTNHPTSSARTKKRKYMSRGQNCDSQLTSARSHYTDGGESSWSIPPVWSMGRDPTLGTGLNYMSASSAPEGAGAGFDGNSSYSSIQSIREQHSKLKAEQTKVKSVKKAEESNTLFETLRDTIYTEVASLISQNESRPHFLLELFRDIRKVDSDFMRQRTLYALEDLLKSSVTDTASFQSPSACWVKAEAAETETGNCEQTPSESVTSDDDEQLQVTRLQEDITAAERMRLSRSSARPTHSLQGFPFDYAELADNPSSLSTPTNGTEDAPFFQDTLGETVIRLDTLRSQEAERALSKEKNKGRGAPSTNEERRQKPTRWGQGAFLASEQLLRDMRYQSVADRVPGGAGVDDQSEESHTRWRSRLRPTGPTGAVYLSQESQASSALDQASESSMSDMPYPRIDMKQLDRQIKAIMLNTIPVVKEHMEDVCSGQLLAYIKRLVLSLTRQLGNQDLARFFHRQLASILEDSLHKYHGRKMRECGEDLLVEISDVLFNELAFFRLMQDLDDPNVASRLCHEKAEEKNDSEYSSSSSEGNHKKAEKKSRDVQYQEEAVEAVEATHSGFLITEVDQDKLGRERDDELANQVAVDGAEQNEYDDDDDEDDDETEQSYKIELAPSETKPFTRIGSDEDDDDGDEEHSMEDPSETAVSRDSMLDINNTSSDQPAPQHQVDRGARPDTEGSHGDGTEKQDREKPVGGATTSPTSTHKLNGEVREAVEDPNATEVNCVTNADDRAGGHLVPDPELTVDDLPDRLDVQGLISNVNNSSISAELRQRFEEEQRSNMSIDVLIASIDGPLELSGDGTAISHPDGFLFE